VPRIYVTVCIYTTGPETLPSKGGNRRKGSRIANARRERERERETRVAMGERERRVHQRREDSRGGAKGNWRKTRFSGGVGDAEGSEGHVPWK